MSLVLGPGNRRGSRPGTSDKLHYSKTKVRFTMSCQVRLILIKPQMQAYSSHPSRKKTPPFARARSACKPLEALLAPTRQPARSTRAGINYKSLDTEDLGGKRMDVADSDKKLKEKHTSHQNDHRACSRTPHFIQHRHHGAQEEAC